MSDFDYGDLAVINTTPFTLRADGVFISGTVLLALGIIGSFLVYFSLICRRGCYFRGNRYYCFFLVTCNLLYLVDLVSNYDSFPFSNMMEDEIRRLFSDFKPVVIEWFNICYCWLTAFLFVETIIRSRLNISGFPHVIWIFYGFIVTILPGAYMILKKTIWKYKLWDPEPYSLFHLIGLLFLIISTILLIIAAVFLICCHKTISHGKYSVSAFVGVFFYGIITVWWQFPAGYEIGRSLMASRIDPQVMIEMLSKISSLVSVFNTTKDYAMLSLSAVSTWLMLLVMPGVSLFGVGTKKVVSSRIGDSGEKALTAA